MPSFPYDGKTILAGAADPNVSALQNVVNQMQDVLLGIVQPDSKVKIICHFDNSLAGHLGQPGTGTGAIRYWSGKYGNAGVLIEQGNTNLLPNPSAEVDLTAWSAIDTAANLARDTVTSYKGNNTNSIASFRLDGSGEAGLGYIKSSVTVTQNKHYSASAYVFSPTAAMAKIELAFSGGTPVTSSSSPITLTPGQWTRIRFENQPSNNNTTCEVRIYLLAQAPVFPVGSRLSTLTPTSTAPVTDAGMTLNAGDIVLCAVTANPSGPRAYAGHMVTTGATGVSSASLRLDDAVAAPTFVAGTQLSRLAPAGGDSVLVTDNALVLNAGDFVFCNLQTGYDWHVVTTGATGVSNAALRLDDGPVAPNFAVGSRLTRIVPAATAPVTDNAMTITAGDMVYCRTLNNPVSSNYAWHMVTTGATGVNSPNLRLDGAMSAPVFGNGSRFSKLSPAATGDNVDMGATLTTGDFALAYPTRNPIASGYGWHMITTGATGVANTNLRLNQALSDTLNVDCVQLEPGPVSTGFTDAAQGSGFTGALGSVTNRAATMLTYPTAGNLTAGAGTVAFWLFPLWAGNDGKEHILFDMAVGPKQNRIRFSKDASNALNVTIYDTNGGMKQWLSPAMVFSRETWQHIGFSYNAGAVSIYFNGVSQALTPSGGGTGQIANLPVNFHLGTEFNGLVFSGSVFDDLVIANAALTADHLDRIGTDSGPYLGLASANKGFDTAQGTATTDAVIGNQTTIAHGLGLTPTFIQITERDPGVVYLSSDADATNFYVKGTASSVEFDWRAFA